MSHTIKVLHIIKSLGRGGAEMLLPESLKLHNRERFEFHYIYFLPWKDQMVNAIHDEGGAVTCLSASNNIEIFFKLNKVKSYIQEHQIEIVHCHLPWAGLIGRLLCRMTGIPTLYTEHNKQERYHWVTKIMNRWTFNLQTAAVAVSNDVANSIREHIRIRIPIHVIPNGVNINHFRRSPDAGIKIRKELNIPSEAIVIGTIAVFRSQKRLDKWLEIFASLSEKHPHLYGIVIGDGPLRGELRSQADDLQLGKKLVMPGLQTEIRPWLSAMDIFMMSSVFEGMPVALLEAMSMECAVATTDAGGIKEVMQDGKNGLMVSVHELDKLEAAMAELIINSEYRRRLAIEGRRSVVERFAMQRMVNQLEETYLNYVH